MLNLLNQDLKQHKNCIKSTYNSEKTDDIDNNSHMNTDTNILPTIIEYGEKVSKLLESYQTKSKEVIRVEELWKKQHYPQGIKVFGDYGDYYTSTNSQNIVTENKSIINNILKYSIDRQIYKTDEEINNYKRIQKFTNKSLKIKIRGVKPKIQDELKEAINIKKLKELRIQGSGNF